MSDRLIGRILVPTKQQWAHNCPKHKTKGWGSTSSLLTVMSDKCHPQLRPFSSFLKNKNKSSAVLPKAFPVYRVCVLAAVLKCD